MSGFSKHILYIFIATVISLLPQSAVADTYPELPEWLDSLKKNPDDVQILKKVATAYLNLNDYEKSLEYGKRLVEVGNRNGDRDFAVLYGNISIGHAASMLNLRDETFRAFENARVIAELSENHDALTSAYNGLGMYYINLANDPYSSISCFYDALKHAKISGNEKYYVRILANLSCAYLLREDIAGLKYCQEAYDTAVKIGDEMSRINAGINLADYYLRADSVEKALSYLDEVNNTTGLSPTELLEVGMLNALCEYKSGKRDEGLNHAKSVLEEYHDEAFKPSVSYQYYIYGDMLGKAGKYAEAIKVLTTGLEYSEENDISMYKGILMKALADCYHKSGDYANAFAYTRLYMQYSDSIHDIDRERVIEDARVRHNIALQETKIARQEQELAKERSKFYILFILLAFAIAALVAGWYVYIRNKRLYVAIVRQNKEFILREKELLTQLEKNKASSHEDDLKGKEDIRDPESELMNRFTSLMAEDKLYKDSSLTVATVAEKLGTNRTYLSRTINESTGKTFNQIVNGYRIKEAISLISDVESDMPLKQVCSESGFSSTSTFYSLFQNFTGLTPAKYRSQIKNL